MPNRRGRSHLDHGIATDNLGRQLGERWSWRQNIDTNTRTTQILCLASREVTNSSF